MSQGKDPFWDAQVKRIAELMEESIRSGKPIVTAVQVPRTPEKVDIFFDPQGRDFDKITLPRVKGFTHPRQPLVAAMIPPHAMPAHVIPGGIGPVSMNAPYTGGRTSPQAIQHAQSNGWDVLAPKGDELFIDIDSDAQYQAYLRAKPVFEQNIMAFVAEAVIPSKSGTPGKKHIYIRLSRALGSRKTRITYQAMLQSDAVREILSQSRYDAGDPEPVLFFENPGCAPKGFGRYLYQAPAVGSITVSASPAPKQSLGYFTKPSAPAQPKPAVFSSAPAPADPNDPTKWPHKCDRCGGPAYNGLFSSDCKNKCH